jgi:hypothetical protein
MTAMIGKKITIQEALQLTRSNPDASIIWRPEENLPEEQQYALVRNES